jgi:NADPH:quinone reductase-like Zn-dependent oxidoreductase
MKAIVYTQYGSPDELQFKEIAQPTPKDKEVLIEVHAAAVNAGDWHLLRGKPFLIRLSSGLRKPKHPILGADVSGKVVAVGPNVTRFQPGDEVFGDLSDAGYGAFAEYVSADEGAFVRKPTNVTFEQAAAVLSAAVTALQGLRDEGQIQPGQQVLVNGASGGVGSFAVQIAKALGAEVTGVCSTRNVEMVRGLGANHVIDYTKQDFTQNGRQYDLILDAAAYRPLTDYKRAMTAHGRYVMVGGSAQRYFQMMVMGPWLSQKGGQHFGTFIKAAKPKDLAFLKDLVDGGKVAPVIDRRYPLREVAEAIRYVEAGHAHGKVVITVT